MSTTPLDLESVSDMSTPQDAESLQMLSDEQPSPPLDGAGFNEDEEIGSLVEEAALGSTEAGAATNEMLRALSRAARSFLLYDPRNEAIRAFLVRYRETMYEALEQFGTLTLEMRPFEMLRDGEIVYLERARDRSLAFRMYRDGVRRLTVEPEVEWTELLKLLEILSIRFTGVRQQEDDIVTLLWKAGFKNIEVTAVEGFVPDDDDDDEVEVAARTARKANREEDRVDVPRDWDTPLPKFDGETSISFVPLAEPNLVALREEVSSQELPRLTVRLVEQMMVVVADITDPTSIDDIAHLIEEVRDFLLAEGQLATLTRLARLIKDLLVEDPEQADKLLASFTDGRALRRIVHSIGKGREEAPPEMIELLDLIPADHLVHLIDILAVERGVDSRQVLRKLISRYTPRAEDYVLERMKKDGDSGVSLDLLRAFSMAVPKRTIEAVESVIERQETDLHYEMLRVLGDYSVDERVRPILMRLMGSPVESIRLKSLQQLVSNEEIDLYADLLEYVEKRAGTGLKPSEAETIGIAMAKANQKNAQRLFSEWIRPRNIFKRYVDMPGRKMLRWTAVSGLGTLSGQKNEKLIQWMGKQAGEDLHKHCIRTLYLRRKEGIE